MSDAAVEQQREFNNNIAALVASQAKMFEAGMKPDAIQKVHTIKVIEEDIVEAELDEEYEVK
jgi:hypothetical protein